MKKVIFTTFILLNVVSNSKEFSEQYWEKLKEKAEKIYGGYNYELNLNIGNCYSLEKKDENNESRIGVEFSIPLLSKNEKIDKKERKTEFLEKGAKYIEIIENNRKQIDVLKEKEIFLKENMKEYGIEGINGYYECRTETAKKTAEIKSAEREIEAMLK